MSEFDKVNDRMAQYYREEKARPYFQKWQFIIASGMQLAAIGVAAVALYISFVANDNSRIAMETTQASVEIQRQEFMLRNRPILTLDLPTTSVTLDRLVQINFPIRNVSHVPARNVSMFVWLLQDKDTISTMNTAFDHSLYDIIGTQIVPITLTEVKYWGRGQSQTPVWGLAVTLVYEGMIGDTTDAFTTNMFCSYQPWSDSFYLDALYYDHQPPPLTEND